MDTCVSRLKPYYSQVSTPFLTILAPSLDILPFDFRLVVTLSPDDQSKSILTTIILITIRDEPAVRIESFGYGFVGPVAIRELLPFVTSERPAEGDWLSARLHRQRAPRFGRQLCINGVL